MKTFTDQPGIEPGLIGLTWCTLLYVYVYMIIDLFPTPLSKLRRCQRKGVVTEDL